MSGEALPGQVLSDGCGHYDLPFPVAIKVTAGKINAARGETWRLGLHPCPQDYMVSPEQPWLDGYTVEKGVIRQFVAMPLGEGYTAEERLTGEADWGGVQIAVVPLRGKAWRAKREQWEKKRQRRRDEMVAMAAEPPMEVVRLRAMASRASEYSASEGAVRRMRTRLSSGG